MVKGGAVAVGVGVKVGVGVMVAVLGGKGVSVGVWLGVWEAGQGLGTSKTVEPTATVVDRLVGEYAQAVARMKALPWAAAPQ